MSYSNRGAPAPRVQNPPQPVAPPVQSIPETILIECARNTAPSLNNGLNSNPASWTCNFDGGIQLKAGDAISINSATLNSVGVGALINFTLDNTNNNQNNKATWIHSFFVTNDGKNDKRESVNMDALTDGGEGIFRWDTTNNDCDLYRWADVGVGRDDAQMACTYFQDNFLPLRVAKTDVPMLTNSLSQSLDIASYNYVIRIITSTQGEPIPIGNATYFSINSVDVSGNIGGIINIIDQNIFQRGRVYQMIPAEVGGMDDPSFYTDDSTYAIFGVVDIFENIDGYPLNIPNGQYVKATPMGNLILDSDNAREQFQVKAVEFKQIQGDVNFGLEGLLKSYQYTPAFYDWEQQLFNVRDDVYQVQYELLNPADIVTEKFVIPTSSAGQIPKGIVVKDNLLKYQIDILSMPSGTEGGKVFPQEGYVNSNFVFRYHFKTYNTIDEIVTENSNFKQFGVRIYTQQGYKYAMLFIGADGDGSTIVNGNTITATTTGRGCQMFFGVNEKPTSLRDNGEILLTDDIPIPLDSVDNPHEILYLGNLSQNINIRFFNTIQQQFIGNYQPMKNVRNPGSVTYEIYWLKSAIDAPQKLLRADYSNVFPVHIENYIGGLVRSFSYFEADDATPTAFLQPDYQYVRHYEHFNFTINSSWNSPSDIATALTDQTHQPQDARTRDGSVISNSAGLGIPHNRLCIPVWTSNNASEADLLTNNNLEIGSFKIVDPLYSNVKPTPPFVNDGKSQNLAKTNVDIFFRTGNTSINYPSSIINTQRNLVYNGANPVNKGTQLPPDFNQGEELMGSLDFVRTARSVSTDGTIVPYPLTYIQGEDAYISQFAGANDISFGWDDNLSRFTIGDLHVGIYSLSQIGDTATGGQEEVKIYCPAIPYKKNQVRSGGIKVQNWNSMELDIGMGLESIISFLNLPYNFNFNATSFTDPNEWFLTESNKDDIGGRFWNKLGYDDTQVGTGGSLVNVSTNNEIDTALAIVPSEEPASNRPAYSDFGNFDTDNGNTNTGSGTTAGFEFSSFGNLNFNNHTIGMGGVPNTEGAPLQFFSNVSVNLNRAGITTLDADQASKVIDSEGQYNPDREFNTYYTVSTKDDMTTTLNAKNLPVKTEFSYFYILSDLVESKFYSSKNGGMPINCIGTINKLNSDNDYYFSYASPQRIYVTQDRIVTSITTSVKNIDFSDPAIIGNFSSVVYQIDRLNPIPETIPLPVEIQQANYYNQLYELTQQVLKESNLPSTEDATLQVLEDLYVGGEPTDNRAEIVEDILEYGLQEVETTAQTLISQFLVKRKDRTEKVTRKEFKQYLDDQKGVSPDVKEEALQDWKSVEASRQGMAAVVRGDYGANFGDPELIPRLRRGDNPRRGRAPTRPTQRPVPPYLLPPSFDEPNPTVEEPEE